MTEPVDVENKNLFESRTLSVELPRIGNCVGIPSFEYRTVLQKIQMNFEYNLYIVWSDGKTVCYGSSTNGLYNFTEKANFSYIIAKATTDSELAAQFGTKTCHGLNLPKLDYACILLIPVLDANTLEAPVKDASCVLTVLQNKNRDL